MKPSHLEGEGVDVLPGHLHRGGADPVDGPSHAKSVPGKGIRLDSGAIPDNEREDAGAI